MKFSLSSLNYNKFLLFWVNILLHYTMEKRSKKDDFFIINTQTNGSRTSERYYAD